MVSNVFPPRCDVLGVGMSRTSYHDAVAAIVQAAHRRTSALVGATSAHGLTLAARDPNFAQQLNDFDMLTPDGQPVRWAMNLLHGADLRERVYGPTLMLRVCEAAAREGLGIYLYGSRVEVLERLVATLRRRFPGLRVAGFRSPPFRPLTASEDEEDVHDIRASGASVVFVGLGCPRQEQWAHAHRDRLAMPLICVGAAFDMHAGTLPQAPPWMQNRGLEWLFRLIREPRRLWRRYVTVVPTFAWLVARQYFANRWDGARPSRIRHTPGLDRVALIGPPAGSTDVVPASRNQSR